MSELTFARFNRELTVHLEQVSYSHLEPPADADGEGGPAARTPARLRLTRGEIGRLLGPYLKIRLLDQLRAVVPLAVYLVAFQLIVLGQSIENAVGITVGLGAVVIGLAIFMEGLKVGLMPFGEALGLSLPARATLTVVLLVVFLLGIGVTFAEPAIGALQTAGSLVDPAKAPYLYALLTRWATALVLAVGVGVGAAACLGTLRSIFGWSLKPLIYTTLVPVLALTVYLSLDPDLAKVVGLAFDCGAVTTGPVTVPLVLALGIGMAHAAGRGGDSLSGFGIVTLASLFPILAVMILALVVAALEGPGGDATAVAATVAGAPWHSVSPWLEIIGGVRAIVPLVLFLLGVMYSVLGERVPHARMVAVGIGFCVIGMIVFNLGLSYGLSRLGAQSGSLVPAAFTALEGVPDSPLFRVLIGIGVAIAFAWVLGFGATLAEPALNALGLTVERLTNGSFRKSTLMIAVSFGVACGIALGVAKIIFDWPIAMLLIPGYLVAVVLTWLSDEEYVNIAWDSAGVTTGPVTVPLVLAMGLGFGNALGAVEGFGILSMASIGPILAVLATGLYVKWKIERRHRREDEEDMSVVEGLST